MLRAPGPLTSHAPVREVAINAELIEEERRERERATTFGASLFNAVKFALGQGSGSQRQYMYDAPRSLPSTASLGIGGPVDSSSAASTPASAATLSPPGSQILGHAGAKGGSAGYQGSPPRYVAPAAQSPAVAFGPDKPAHIASHDAWYTHGAAYYLSLPIALPLSLSNAALAKVRGVAADANTTAYAYQAQQQQQEQLRAAVNGHASVPRSKSHSSHSQRRLESYGKA